MHFIELRRTDTEWRPIFKYIVPFYTNRNYPKENKDKIGLWQQNENNINVL